MPDMTQMVRDWLRMQGDEREPTAERTAKSYFLQEAEGISRQAKLAWAEQRQGVHATNLQHDGVVFRVPDGMSREDLENALSGVCSDALGYPQPVEEKRFGDDEEQCLECSE